MKIVTKISIIFLLSINFLVAQEAKETSRIFKFNPLQLVTNSLSFGLEKFNEDRSRSHNLSLGIRFSENSYDNFSYGTSGESIENRDIYKGLTGIYERRIYIPKFKYGKANLLNSESSQYGVYLAPGLRLDYNNLDFQNGYFDVRFGENGDIVEERRVVNAGNNHYFGIMPFANLGIQFSIFQYGFIDLHLGGGLRVNIENENLTQSSPGYRYSNSGPIESLILKQGVLPSGGISIGVRM